MHTGTMGPPGPDLVEVAAGCTLAGIGALHVAWGLRLPLPGGGDPGRWAETVAGSSDLPSPTACFAVAGALGAASALLFGVPSRAPAIRDAGRVGVAVVLAGRGALGLAGRTELVAPGPTSATFRRWDRWLYTPLCLALAGAAARAAVHGRAAAGPVAPRSAGHG